MNWTDRLGLCAVLVVSTLVPAIGNAQAPTTPQAGWLSDRDRAEGPGFRVGDFELHPGLGIEIGYDSNLYYTDDANRLGLMRDSAILRAVAHLLFSTRGEQRQQEGEGGGEGSGAGPPTATFRGGISGSFYHFFNDNSRTNMEVDADLALTILPERTFSIDITENFGRSVRPFTELTLAATSYARIQNNAGLRLNFQTDGGVLRIGLGYNFLVNYFEDANFGYGNTLGHVIALTETFRFLPQTAIIHDTSFRVNDVLNEATIRGPLMNDGFLLRTRIGLNGAFTTNFSVLALVGYGAGFFNSRATVADTYDQEYESVVAQVEARWQILPNVRLHFGYDRDFQPSFIGNFMRQDRGYINFQTLVDRVFLLGADVSLGYVEFGAPVDVDGTLLGTAATRGDIRFVGRLFMEYRFTDWLGVNGTFRYQGNFTDFQYNLRPTMGVIADPASYNKVELWLGVRVFY